MDNDGDVDLIATTMAEATISVFTARTECDGSREAPTPSCCLRGTEWNGTHCQPCAAGLYGGGTHDAAPGRRRRYE